MLRKHTSMEQTTDNDKKDVFVIKAKDRRHESLTKEKQKAWTGPFCFIQAADTQFGMIDSYIYKKTEVSWDEEIRLTRKAVQKANLMIPKPKFFIICGDLVDAMPGDKNKPAQERDLKKVLLELDTDIPLVCVCGNHDIGNTPTRQSIQNYRNSFGDDYFSFWVSGVKFIVLNSQLYEDSSQVPELKTEQDIWLDEELEDAQVSHCQHLVIFQHIPWFLRTPDEEKEYFNIEMGLRMMMLQKFKDTGVKAIFCGHYHRNAGGFYKGMELIVTSAVGAQIGDDKSGCRIVKVMEDAVTHKYFDLDSLPASVDLTTPDF